VPARAAILALGACLVVALGGRGASGREAEVYVTSASVARAEGGTTFLDEGPDGWKVSVAGCTPTAQNLPYDCVLED
jgi:hypothetical protein